MQILKDSLLVFGIALGLLTGLEAALWAFAPHHPVNTFGPQRAFATPDSLLNHRLLPNATQHQRTPEFDLTYQTNGAGLRVHPVEPDAVLKVLVLGDSFTFGVGARTHETWPAHLQRTLKEKGISVQVINAGVMGYDTLSQLRFAKELLPRYEPDIVLLGFLVNDLMTNRERSEKPVNATSSPPRWSPARLHIVPFAKRILLNSDWLYTRLYLSTSRADFFRSPPPAHVQKQLEVTVSLLSDLADEIHRQGAQFSIVSIPQQIQLVGSGRALPDDIDLSFANQYIANHDSLRSVQWIETTETIKQTAERSDQPLYFRLDGHLTALGYRTVGLEVADALAAHLPVARSLLAKP